MPVDRYALLPTEHRNPRSRDLDRRSPHALVQLMHAEDLRAIRAMRRALPAVARAIRLTTAALRRKGRLILVGAGTSGRLAVLEAAECPPTFSTPPSKVQAIIAGGPRAVFRSREGIEDRRDRGAAAIRRRARAGDVVVGIAASGLTPFVAGALGQARRLGATTILLTCAPRSAAAADVRIVLPVGPEVLTGSTRLKAGTATKLALNMLTLGTMIQLGKTYGNLMVDVRPTSRKLRARAIRMVQTLTGCSPAAASRHLASARQRVPIAVLMATQGFTYPDAVRRLARCGGSLRQALHGV